MQLQQEQAIKYCFKEQLLKQASDATGVNISNLRQSPNVETQINRINTMLKPTQFTEESSVTFHQGSNPTQHTDESSETFHQDTQVVNISDEIDTAAPADTEIDEQVARAKSLADYEIRQAEIRTRHIIEGVGQEAVSALLQQEHKYTQQRAQDHAQAAATIQQIEHQAQGFIDEAQGAIYEIQGARQKERQEREMMKAEEEKAKQAEKKLN